MQQQMVKVYKSLGTWNGASHKFARDAEKLARQGWTVQSQSATRSTSLFAPKSATVTVVYVRQV